ncbi:MAG: DUF6436 domain-containing protein [Oleibacter sp.]|nr:DUF6436 domain-containing protein [Thalassolituus sp.]
MNKNTWIIALVIVWIGASLGGLTWMKLNKIHPFVPMDAPYQMRDIEQVTSQLENFLNNDAELIKTGSLDNRVTLMHFYNPDCFCNAVSKRHLDEVLKTFNAETLRWVIVVPFDTDSSSITTIQQRNPRAVVVRDSVNLPISSSPSLAVFSNKHELAYFGAYGFGALCTLSEENIFVSMVSRLQQSAAGESDYGPFLNIAGSGCFCAWPKTVSPEINTKE